MTRHGHGGCLEKMVRLLKFIQVVVTLIKFRVLAWVLKILMGMSIR